MAQLKSVTKKNANADPLAVPNSSESPRAQRPSQQSTPEKQINATPARQSEATEGDFSINSEEEASQHDGDDVAAENLTQSATGRSLVNRSAEQVRPSTPRPSTTRQAAKPQNASRRQRERKQKGPTKQQQNWTKEVRRLQKSVSLLIPRLPFSRLIREILQSCGFTRDMRITKEALLAIQESAEMYLTYFFEDSFRLAMHAKRVTLIPKDMQLIFSLRQNWGNL